jgi:hypothetical protein
MATARRAAAVPSDGCNRRSMAGSDGLDSQFDRGEGRRLLSSLDVARLRSGACNGVGNGLLLGAPCDL